MREMEVPLRFACVLFLEFNFKLNRDQELLRLRRLDGILRTRHSPRSKANDSVCCTHLHSALPTHFNDTAHQTRLTLEIPRLHVKLYVFTVFTITILQQIMNIGLYLFRFFNPAHSCIRIEPVTFANASHKAPQKIRDDIIEWH